MMRCQHQTLEHPPHLAPALTAVILCVAVLAAFGFYARSLEDRSIMALAADQAVIERDGELSPVKNQGTALQQSALETASLLPIFGSSELTVQADYTRPFHATNLFRDLPTGFTVFPVGKAETTCLIILQKLAAVGPELVGRKLAVSLSPFWFFNRLAARATGYAGNFSTLHAGELTFNNRLSRQLRHDAALRMLRYPATLANRPLLRLALESLADGSPLSLACYEAVRPLGMMQNTLLRNLDHLRVVYYLWTHPVSNSSSISSRESQPLDWAMLHRQADELYRAHSDNNEFGMDNEKWDLRLRETMDRQRNRRSDKVFLDTLQGNQEWVDLELLLRELNELGAQPLLLSMPIHGGWYGKCGITYTARRAYYQKLREIGARYHAPVVDFADHDADQSFCLDELGHLAPSGLVYYSQILDDFVHNAIPRQPEIPTVAPAAREWTVAGYPPRPVPDSRPPSESCAKPSTATPIKDNASRTHPEPTSRVKGESHET